MRSEDEKQRVLDYLKRYGYQSQSYNILRDDKSYFFSPSGKDGVIAYVVHANIALAAGDPVCDPSDLSEFAGEFRFFCRTQKWRCCFQAVTDRCRDRLADLGFSTIKIGEEPIFDLDGITWEGGQFRGVRKDIRRARKHGLEVVEYKPLVGRRPDWENQMEELSDVWKKIKGSGEFSFLIGEPGLVDPGDRKYFLVLLENRVEAFVVCNPIYARNGIYFDLMRRRQKTIDGTSQLLITESFRLLKEQGYEMAALGTAPLASKHVDDQSGGQISHIIELALDLAFDHLGYFHRYKPIYEFKKQFGPSSWESCFLAYGSRGFDPLILYALLKAYDPSGVKGKLSRQIQRAWVSIRKFDKVPASLLKKLRDRDSS